MSAARQYDGGHDDHVSSTTIMLAATTIMSAAKMIVSTSTNKSPHVTNTAEKKTPRTEIGHQASSLPLNAGNQRHLVRVQCLLLIVTRNARPTGLPFVLHADTNAE